MKVTFNYIPQGASGTTALPLALGQRLSPIEPVTFSHTGIMETVAYPRSRVAQLFPRYNGTSTERFTAIREFSSHWLAMVFTRRELQAIRGVGGTLVFLGDTGGSLTLANCVCISAAGNAPGATAVVSYEFAGGTWSGGLLAPAIPE